MSTGEPALPRPGMPELNKEPNWIMNAAQPRDKKKPAKQVHFKEMIQSRRSRYKPRKNPMAAAQEAGSVSCEISIPISRRPANPCHRARGWKSGSRVAAKRARGSDGGRERSDGHLPSASQSNHFPNLLFRSALFRPTGRAPGAWTPADGRSVRNKNTPAMTGLASNSAKQISRITRKSIPRDPSEQWQVFSCPSPGCRPLRSRG